MSGHHPFQRLVENLPEERKLAIPSSGGYANEQKKKAMLAEIELREAIFQRKGYANESSIDNWYTSTTSIDSIKTMLD
jgi:transposase